MNIKIPLLEINMDNETYTKNGKVYDRVTRIIHYMVAKGIGYEKWLGNSGSYDAACAIRDKAAESGTRLHKHFARMVQDFSYMPDEELEEDEWKKYFAYKEWIAENIPERYTILNCEGKENTTFYSDKYGYAGSYDLLLEGTEDKAIVIADNKTGNSAYLYDGYLQLNMYAWALFEEKGIVVDELVLLHVGPKKVKEHWLPVNGMSVDRLMQEYKIRWNLEHKKEKK